MTLAITPAPRARAEETGARRATELARRPREEVPALADAHDLPVTRVDRDDEVAVDPQVVVRGVRAGVGVPGPALRPNTPEARRAEPRAATGRTEEHAMTMGQSVGEERRDGC